MIRAAAIDCGTNSIRLLVADVPVEGGHTDVVRRMEVVRLGQGVDATGRLAPEAIERTRKVLAEYAAQAQDHGVTAVRMAATSATRDAANRADFEDMVVATLGQKPDVVPGREEAELSTDPQLAAGYRAAHAAYLAERDARGVLPTRNTAGGMPDRVKCLHALAGHALAAGPGVNPIGDRAVQEMGQWWANGPCVCLEDDA